MRRRTLTWTLGCSVFIGVFLLAGARAQETTPAGVGKPDQDGVTIRVAAISFVPTKFDLPGNADRLEQAFRQAKQGNAQLAVAPEGALEGYVVNEIIAGSAPAAKMNEVAIPVDHPVIRRFQKLAAELEMCLAFGFAERMEGDVFNCAIFIDHHGRICGKYHKMQLAEGYDPAWWFNRLGSESRAFDTPYGRCGILICNDRWNPALARIPVLDGAQYLLIPSFGSRSKSQDEAVLKRASENGVPVVEANVGVTLVIDRGEITAVDRRDEGITFGQITIPSRVEADAEQRDRVEREFLEQRGQEMRQRLESTLKRLKRNAVPESGRESREVDPQKHRVGGDPVGNGLRAVPESSYACHSNRNATAGVPYRRLTPTLTAAAHCCPARSRCGPPLCRQSRQSA